MTNKLLESEFLPVTNFKNINKLSRGTSPAVKQLPDKLADWGEELATRRKNKVSGQSDSELESEFFADFFEFLKKLWGPETADKLEKLGENFKKALLVLGFNTEPKKGSNPILAFVEQEYVRRELLGPGLLNIGTFKAVYNAVAKNLTAQSEFYKHGNEENTYNILYCRELYRRPPDEIEKYLELQRNYTLGPSLSVYTDAIKTQNKKIFIYIDVDELEPKKLATKIKNLPNDKVMLLSMTDRNAKLNSYEVAKTIAESIGGRISTQEVQLDSNAQGKLASKLTTAQQIYAALQFLSVTTANENANQALMRAEFKGLSIEQITKATTWLAAQKIMPVGNIGAGDADDLVTVLLGRLTQLRQQK